MTPPCVLLARLEILLLGIAPSVANSWVIEVATVGGGAKILEMGKELKSA